MVARDSSVGFLVTNFIYPAITLRTVCCAVLCPVAVYQVEGSCLSGLSPTFIIYVFYFSL